MSEEQQFELIDLDASNLREYEKEIGEADIMAYFPSGRYVWNIDRINIVEKYDEESKRIKHDTIYIFKMAKMLFINKEDEIDRVPDQGGKALIYVNNPVVDPKDWRNIGWKEAAILRRVALSEEVLDTTPYREQLEVLESVYKEDNYLACSILHQKDKSTGQIRIKFGTDWEVYQEK